MVPLRIALGAVAVSVGLIAALVVRGAPLLRRATGTETTEETTFDRFRINTKIDPKKFEVRK